MKLLRCMRSLVSSSFNCVSLFHISSLRRLRSNKIKKLPDLSLCKMLQQLDLGLNMIENLPEKPFENQRVLADLLLDRYGSSNILLYILILHSGLVGL